MPSGNQIHIFLNSPFLKSKYQNVMKLKYECDFLGIIFFTKFCENELMILQTFDKTGIQNNY